MKFTGKVSEFNRITGRGVISSKASGKVNFNISQVVGGTGKLDAGDHVEFEVGFVDGVSQALGVSVMSRLAAQQKHAARAQVDKPIDEEKADFIGRRLTNLPLPPDAPGASNAPVLPVPTLPTVEAPAPTTRKSADTAGSTWFRGW